MNLKKDLCSGCEACYSICPRNAITMEENSEGFRYPVIDKALCTNCGLCEKICHGEKFINNKNPECYAYMADDDIRKKSASGGVFPVLAYHFINNGGDVCGAVWDSDWSVKHIVSNKAEDIEKMRSSKYLQSRIENCYKEIKDLLDKGTKVLFTGTPCQVNGLKSFLRKDYKNLFCVDLICHGVPSAKVFKKYLQENFDVSKIKDFNFRDKRYKGWSCRVSANNNIVLNNDYLELFLKSMLFRKGCGECLYNKLPRSGDMTMGDFWGINKFSRKLNDSVGTSVVLVNNKKGDFLLNILKSKAKKIKKVPLKYAKAGNANIYMPSDMHPERDKFYENLDALGFEQSKEKIFSDKCDCMIVNLWYSSNYGASLTCFGVQCLIEQLGLNAKIINYVSPEHLERYKDGFAEKFAAKYLNLTTPCSNYNDLINLNRYCSTFITGSDQVFGNFVMNTHSKNVSRGLYLLSFAGDDAKKISYAASFGEYGYSNNTKVWFNSHIKQFDAVSAREDVGVKLLKDEYNVSAEQLIDGAFFIPKEKLEEMTRPYVSDEKYIAYYCLPYYLKRDWHRKFVKQISEKMGLPVKELVFDKNVTVEQWLAHIKNAEFVISDSFHANVFAIIFNKRFCQIKNGTQARFESLFRLLDIENNSISQYDSELDFDKIFVKRDWERINKKIESEVKRAHDWMKKVLDAPTKSKNGFQMINALYAEYHIDKENLDEKLFVITNKDKIYRRYLRYKILSKIMSGKKRAYYTEKRDKFKKYVKILRENKLR